jgi:hypothetical protein
MKQKTEKKERITRPFTFLKTSSNALTAHCQATHNDTQTKACQRAAILPTQKVYLYLYI